jgi:hypothetical protein
MTKAKEEKQLTVPTSAIQNADMGSFISQAIEKNVPAETIERLLAVWQQVKAENARDAFTEAMSAFQGECPVIEKKKVVRNKDGTIRYTYAPLEKIVVAVKDILRKNGLSYTLDTTHKEGHVKAICKVTHILGHAETSSFEVPIDTEGFMNQPQKYASALTFAKRYAFCNALGILTGDEDDDATNADTEHAKQTVVDTPNIVTNPKTGLEEPKLSSDSRQEGLGFCPKCNSNLKLIPSGVSKRTGKRYKAFIGCTNRACKFTDSNTDKYGAVTA